MTLRQFIGEPGFFPDLDPNRYFDDPAPDPSLNQSTIRKLNATSPHHAAVENARLNPYGRRRRDETKALWLGSAVHRLALGKGKEVSIIRYPDFKSTAARDARDAAVANGRIPILERGYADVVAMADIVRARIDEELDGAPYETEVPMFWRRQTEHGPIWCRGMLDVWCEPLARALDVKTTGQAATDEEISKTIASNGYDVQDPYYVSGIEAIRPDLRGRASFEFLFVETAEPFGSRLFELDETSRMIGRIQIDRAVEEWGRCLAARSWPSYPRRRTLIGTPGWHQKRWADLAATEEMLNHG